MPYEGPIIDAHVHLWDIEQFPRNWLNANAALNRSFGLAEYCEQTVGLPITGMVYVETAVTPHYAFLEAQWAVALAQREQRLQAVVAAVPLEDGGAVRSYLAALQALGPLIKGVRRNLQDEIDPIFCLRPDFVMGVQALADFGFSCDLCIRADQLPAIITLVQHCPAIYFLLDHLGKPAIAQHQLEPWRTHLAMLAVLPNVACKISGMVTEADAARWQPEDLAPYVAHTLAVFGPQRVLFGSDWPVVVAAATYQRWTQVLNELTHHLSPEHQRLLWSENACRWYRLPVEHVM